MNKAINAYQQNSTMVSSPYKLTQMLYEGILKFNSLAKKAIEDRDFEKKGYYINRSCAIYIELLNTLDMKGGEISQYLHGLYNYQLKLLSEANITNSIAKMDEAINVASVLLEAWKEETSSAVKVA